MENVGEKIRKLRISSGLTQTDVASVCGIKQSSYASIESGKTKNISIEVGKGIAKALSVSFGELFEIDCDSQELINYKIENKILRNDLEKVLAHNAELTLSIEDFQKLVAQLVIIIHSKDVIMELWSFTSLREFKNDRNKQKQKLNTLIEHKKNEIKEDIENNVYTIDIYRNVFNIVNRAGTGYFLNLLENIDIDKILDDFKFNMYAVRAG